MKRGGGRWLWTAATAGAAFTAFHATATPYPRKAVKAASEAAAVHSPKTIDILLAAGADPNRLDENKNNALITAAQHCSAAAVLKLAAAART